MALPGLSADAIEAELEKQLAELPRLAAVRSAFNHSAIVHAADRAEATAFSNMYTPSPSSACAPSLYHKNYASQGNLLLACHIENDVWNHPVRHNKASMRDATAAFSVAG